MDAPRKEETEKRGSEEREMAERDHVRPGRAFREGGQDGDEFCTRFLEQLPHGDERAAGRDDVVDDGDLLPLEEGDVVGAQVERLLLVRRDALDRGLEHRREHVGLVLLARDECGELRDPTEHVEECLRLAVRHEQDFRSLRDECGQFRAESLVQLPVTERVEERDADAGGDLPDGESARDRTDGDGVRGLHDEELRFQ